MKKALFITYTFPPMGGAGVQRGVKFMKYLPDYGWLSSVLTVEDPPTPLYDESLLKEVPDSSSVYRAYSLEPTRLLQKISKIRNKSESESDKKENKRAASKGMSGMPLWAIRFIQAFFLPDEKRGWIRYAKPIGEKIINDDQIDILFSSGPPFTAHILAKSLKEKSGLPWVAELRDPWVGNFFIRPITALHNLIIKKMERSVVEKADAVINVIPSVTEDYKKRYPKHTDKFVTIYNGYDGADFNFEQPQKDDSFLIFHMGTFYGDRNPGNFLRALKELLLDDPEASDSVKVKFMGARDVETEDIIKDLGLEKVVELIPYQEHSVCIREMAKARLLLLIISSGGESRNHLAAKTFEYLAASIPILALVGEGDAARILRDTGAGDVVNPDSVEEIKKALVDKFNEYKKGQILWNGSKEEIEKYDRQNLTKELANVFDAVYRKKGEQFQKDSQESMY